MGSPTSRRACPAIASERRRTCPPVALAKAGSQHGRRFRFALECLDSPRHSFRVPRNRGIISSGDR